MTIDVKDAYARRSGEYIDLFGTMESVHPEDRELVSSWSDGLTGPVVDAGCGPGQWTDFLARRGLSASGVDQVPEFVERASLAYPEVQFHVGDLDGFQVAPGSVGGVLAWYSLIHYKPDTVHVPLREFARILRPGGGLLVGLFTWHEVGSFDHAVLTAYRWPLDRFAEELSGAGFDVVATRERREPGARPQGAIVARRAAESSPVLEAARAS